MGGSEKGYHQTKADPFCKTGWLGVFMSNVHVWRMLDALTAQGVTQVAAAKMEFQNMEPWYMERIKPAVSPSVILSQVTPASDGCKTHFASRKESRVGTIV